MVAYSRVQDSGICPPVCHYVNILTSGTATLLVTPIRLAQDRLGIPRGFSMYLTPSETQRAQPAADLPRPPPPPAIP